MWPILVISLADATGRRSALNARLSALGLEAEIVDAIDGRRGLTAPHTDLVDRDGARRKYRRDLTDAELACALSHRALYARIVGQHLPGAIILEDDAVPQPGFAKFVTSEAYFEHDITLLAHRNGRALPLAPRMKRAPFVRACPMINLPYCAAGYTVSRRAARRLLAASPCVSRVADWPMDIRRLGARAIVPRLIEVDPSAGSSIEHDRLAAQQEVKPRWTRLRAP